MKKSILKLFKLTVLSVLIATTSCSSDDDGGGSSSTFELVREDLQGTINDGVVTLESGTYKLTGKLIVGNNATLVIKPGVVIEATELAAGQFESVRYIAVAQGGKIDVQGTSTNPVVMTSAVNTPGAWGGLVICGKAPINKGTSASAEVSDLTYGGTDVFDNSGSIKYLRIEYSGYAYNADKEFNGLSLFGVGKDTTIEYVQVHNGSDDGFEWFGGTVDAKYLVVSSFSSEVGDDLFDWTEGWNGVGQYWYGKRTNNGNRGIEADNNSNNHLAAPISSPTISNLTLIGNNAGPENQAMKLRVGTKAIFDNVVLSNWGTGFDIQHDESISYVGTSLKATNVKFDNVTLNAKETTTAGVSTNSSSVYTENASATGAGNGTSTPTWANGWTVGL